MDSIEKTRLNEITSLHNEIIGHFKQSVEKAILIGELIIKQKQSLKYGEFISWIRDNLPFTDRTARRYMTLYENRDRLTSEIVSEVKLTQCYKLLTGNVKENSNIYEICPTIKNDKGDTAEVVNIIQAKELKQLNHEKGIAVNSIYSGDARDILQHFPDECVNLVLSSPPYDRLRYYDGDVFDFDVFTGIAQQLKRVLKKGGVIVWVVGDGVINGSESLSSINQVKYFCDECGFNLHDTMIYLKNSSRFPAPRDGNRFTQVFEYMFILSKGKPETVNLICDKLNKWAGKPSFGTQSLREANGELNECFTPTPQKYSPRNNIWKYNRGKGYTSKDNRAFQHPAAFPDLLAFDIIRTFTNPGDIVLDPLAGSGTTSVMSKVLTRDYIAIEISEKYCEIIKKRLTFPHDVNELVEKSAIEYNSIVWEDIPYLDIIQDIKLNRKQIVYPE